jgi:MOSC domain-containing protein YiiM
MEEIAIGKVIRFFSKIGVAAIRITSGELRVGDTIKFKGHVRPTLSSMLIQCRLSMRTWRRLKQARMSASRLKKL